MLKSLYKMYHSLFACLMLTTSVGMIYAFSLFIPEITQLFEVSRNYIQFAFALSIFGLGTGAALFGNLVEKNVKLSAALSTCLFSVGLYLTHMSIQFHSIPLLYLGIGVFCGLAEGIAYLCPVKNMVLWFSKSKFKGLIMAISIVSFGLGATLCTFFYKILYPIFGLNQIFLAMCFIYMAMMSIGTIALKKPRYAKRLQNLQPVKVNFSSLLKDPYFMKHWLMMFFNISMGLILIGNRKNILIDANVADQTILMVFAVCGFTNAFGRLLFPFIGDFFKSKIFIIPLIIALEFLFISPAIAVYSIVPISIILVEAGYGGMFATAPQILLEQYGKKPLSIVHGALLSSWACASVFAFMCTLVLSLFTANFYALTIFLAIVYLCMLIVSLTMKKSQIEILK